MFENETYPPPAQGRKRTALCPQIRRSGPLTIVGLALLVVLVGCGTKHPEDNPRYRAPRDLLEIIAVLQHHVPDDTYRFFPARDFTGRNVYRASLLRLENFERIHANALRAGHLDGVLAFAKARALERLRAFDLARENYELAAQRSEPLRDEALAAARNCADLEGAAEIPLLESEADPLLDHQTLKDITAQMLANYGARIQKLDTLAAKLDSDSHHLSIVREERERADWERTRYFAEVRRLSAEGDDWAIAEYQRLLADHPQSKNRNRQLLELANLYATIAREYARDEPPETLAFDSVHFHGLVDSATRLYEQVTRQDGTPERVEATRELEAFLAFTLRIDLDRFAE